MIKPLTILPILCILNIAYWPFSAWIRDVSVLEAVIVGIASTIAYVVIGVLVAIILKVVIR